MSGLFGTLNISKSGLFTQQAAIDTTSHNISNANTEGYSRQRVQMVTKRPYSTGVVGTGQIGTGVEVSSIKRIRDSFLDYHTRVELGVQGKFTGRDQFLSQVENILNEPSDTGISTLLGNFYSSWQQLSKKADTSSAKKVVAEQSLALTNELNHTYNEMEKLKTDAQSLIKDSVFDLNNTLKQISQLNQEIIQVKVVGQEPNDLMDRRDLLLDNLSSKFGIKIDKNNFYGITVTTDESPLEPGAQFGGMAALDSAGNSVNLIQSVNPDNECRFSYINDITDNGGGSYTLSYYKLGDTSQIGTVNVNLTPAQYNTMIKSRVLWADNDGNALLNSTGQPQFFEPPSGELNGYKTVQFDIEEYEGELNNLAKSLAYSVNSIMTQSSTWAADGSYADPTDYNFFVNSTDPSTLIGENSINAGNITVNNVLLNNNTLIKASASSSSGESDGTRASAVASLKDIRMNIQSANLISRNTLVGAMVTDPNLGVLSISSQASGMNMDTYFKDTVDKIGIQEQEALRMVKNQETLLAGFQASKDSVSGVSLDEEMAGLIQYQHAYQANGKVISTVDELLDVVINGLKK
ncbi:MAG: flagellar hook-associated protein FlgK [Solirubrobacterales bacterium]